jgi:hypothetical protein
MTHYFYKTSSPAVVAELKAWDAKKAAFDAARMRLTDVFGAPGSPMKSGTTLYVGGVKLSADSKYDPYWCRQDEFGYRSLRAAPKPPKSITKEERAAIRTEHERLRALWDQHCPARIHADELWSAIGINSGSIWLCGGINFELNSVGYFALGFEINEERHLNHESSSQGTNGWIDGAVEIFPREYEAARIAKVDPKKAEASNG